MKTYNVTLKSPGTRERVLVIYVECSAEDVRRAAEELFGEGCVFVAEAS